MRSAFALCDACAVALWEFLSPEIAKRPGYTARKDQHLAGNARARAAWNSLAADDEQVGP